MMLVLAPTLVAALVPNGFVGSVPASYTRSRVAMFTGPELDMVTLPGMTLAAEAPLASLSTISTGGQVLVVSAYAAAAALALYLGRIALGALWRFTSATVSFLLQSAFILATIELFGGALPLP